ncbi:hypothetical protein D3C71_674480 [compost metagenome]
MAKKSPVRSSKPRKSSRSFTFLSISYIALMLWVVDIFRETFISFLISLVLFIGGGLIAFFLLRKKIPYYKRNQQTFGTFWLAVHGTILFGGIILFLFMALNFYLPIGKTETLNLKVIRSGEFGGRNSCRKPYLIVDYHGFEKQLIFPCHTNVENNGFLKVSLNKGIFGFFVVREMNVIPPTQYQIESDNESTYQKILNRAEEYYVEGNLNKSIELYERAVRLMPSDTFPKVRLKEIKKSLKESSD